MIICFSDFPGLNFPEFKKKKNFFDEVKTWCKVSFAEPP